MSQPDGWYPDPTDPNRERWWNGDAWTQQTRRIGAPPLVATSQAIAQPAAAPGSPYMPYVIAALAAGVGIIVGSIGPWMTFIGMSRTAMDGDGAITLVLGIVAAVMLFAVVVRDGAAGTVLCGFAAVLGVICLVVAVVDVNEVTSRNSELFGREVGAQVGWGLWLMALAAAAMSVAAGIAAWQIRTQNRLV
ncbi:DUF2510 domain-containing protein [Rhodococcus sp. CX]|nr:DUF2510 domain-containing protein [Rhodococcus sp. CX]